MLTAAAGPGKNDMDEKPDSTKAPLCVESPAKGKGLRLLKLWVILGMIQVGAVICLSLAPIPEVPGANFLGSDKIAHCAAYGAMMLWFGQFSRRRAVLLPVASGLVALGIALEFLQGATDYRTFDVADMAANTVGVAVGLLLSMTRLGGVLITFESLLARHVNLPPPRSGQDSRRP
jgi:hypothetical protein